MTTLDVIQRIAEPVLIGRKSVSREAELAAGGPAANAAVTAAALLAPTGAVRLVSALGGGDAARLAAADLGRHRVGVDDCAPAEWPLTVATCIVDEAGERTVVSAGGRQTGFDLTGEARATVQVADVLLLDGHHPTLAEQALAIRADTSPRVARGPVVLDAGSAKPRAEQWLSSVDVLAASADYGVGLGMEPDAVLEHGLAAGCAAVIVTDGARPVRWRVAGGTTRWLTPPRVRAVDTLGAGDAFHGALAAALAGRGACWRESVDEAVASATVVASRRVGVAGARQWLGGLSPGRRPSRSSGDVGA
jgi:sugar/nucleoside kinase (ribokinase family)